MSQCRILFDSIELSENCPIEFAQMRIGNNPGATCASGSAQAGPRRRKTRKRVMLRRAMLPVAIRGLRSFRMQRAARA